LRTSASKLKDTAAAQQYFEEAAEAGAEWGIRAGSRASVGEIEEEGRERKVVGLTGSNQYPCYRCEILNIRLIRELQIFIR